MGCFEVDSEKKEKSTVTGELGTGLCTCAASPELKTKTMRHTELANLNAWPSRALVVPIIPNQHSLGPRHFSELDSARLRRVLRLQRYRQWRL